MVKILQLLYSKTEDNIGNKSELSDSVSVRIYSASGMWTIPDYDSSSCVNHNKILSTTTGDVKQKDSTLRMNLS